MTIEQSTNAAAVSDAERDRYSFFQSYEGKSFYYEARAGSTLEDLLYGDGCEGEMTSGWFKVSHLAPWGPFNTRQEADNFQA